MTLARYGRFVKKHEAYVAFEELQDGSKVLESLYEKLNQAVDEQKQDEVFVTSRSPRWVHGPARNHPFAHAAMERPKRLVDAETCLEILPAAPATWRTSGISKSGARLCQPKEIQESRGWSVDI